MKQILLASASSLAFLALAACSDTDDTQTQSIDQPVEEQPLEQEPNAAPEPEDETPAPSE